ncbi:MAG: hypothetical protein WDW36_004750 [Sanguina aurantia]
MPSTKPVKVTVVGGGAAGLTAAYFAAQSGAKVTVLERTKEAGKKILMSGGNRCNVLPAAVDLQTDFFTESSFSAMKAIFASWSLEQCQDWLTDPDGIGLQLELEEETGKMFPSSNSSREVRDKLLAACLRLGVVMKYSSSVEKVRMLSGEQSVRGTREPDHSTRQTALQSHLPIPDQVLASHGGGGPDAGVRENGSSSSSVAVASVDAATQWRCVLGDGSQLDSDCLVVATGGLSFPAVGTDGTGHRVLKHLGHSLHEPYPALTPLTGAHPAGHQLAGLSLYDVQLSVHLPNVKKPKISPRTGLLFTHRGYSGPSILDLSHHAILSMRAGSSKPEQPSIAGMDGSSSSSSGSSSGSSKSPPAGLPEGTTMCVNWTNETEGVWTERLQAGGTAQVNNLLQRNGVRERLADALCSELGLESKRLCELKRSEREALVRALTSYELPVTGSEGYKKAEVSGGGVPLSELNCATMESRKLPGLYLCGEVVDIFGRIGGFNFLAAWITGRLAGLGAAGSLSKPVRTTESLGRIKTGRRGRGPIAAPAAVAV